MACCSEKKIYKGLCKKHFSAYIEDKVKQTIKEYGLLTKKDKIVVAASGGKDSLAIMNILSKAGYDIFALAIDEGIAGYRDKSLDTLKSFCEEKSIGLKIVSFKNEIGNPLDVIIRGGHRPCTVCGIFRRYLLNTFSKGYDVIVTGHNMDDEAQAVLMNLLKNNIASFSRQGPVSGSKKSNRFTRRVKPLYFCLEKEMMIYSFINGLTEDFNECPHVSQSFRLRVRDYLNGLEETNPGTKERILRWYLSSRQTQIKREDNGVCAICGENSSNDICNACRYMEKIRCS